MTDLEAIELRHSRRSYLETPISKESINVLIKAIEQYNKASGLSIQFVKDGREAFHGFTTSYGFFKGVQSYIALVGKKNDNNLKEKAGYYGEKLVLEAVKLGLGTCWVGGFFSRRRCACQVGEDENLVLVIIVGNVEEKKGFKENVIYKIAHHGTKPLEKLYISDTAVPDWFIEGMKAVQKAPSAANLQPVLFRYQKGSITAEVKDIAHIQLVDLGIAKLHFEIGAGRGSFEPGNGAKLL